MTKIQMKQFRLTTKSINSHFNLKAGSHYINNMKSKKIIDSLLGVAIGDAIGVPYEFKSRGAMLQSPATDMVGFGTYHQAPGVWSDDSALTFCLAESLTKGFNLVDIATNFIAWRDKGYWTATGEVFDIGLTTDMAISRLKDIINSKDFDKLKQLKQFNLENENGNGSLMRIMPLLFFIKDKQIEQQFEIVWEISSLTHRHIRSAMSCQIYLTFAAHLLNGSDKHLAYSLMQNEILQLWDKIDFDPNEKEYFKRLVLQNILHLELENIRSSGYVIDSLEASFWCFLKEDNYKDTILSAVNLGIDTDTTAAIAGGLAGIYYGAEGIPQHWLNSLARLNDIIDLGNRLHEKLFA